MWDSRKRNLIKTLAVLGVFLVVGIAKAKAIGPFAVGFIVLSLFGFKPFTSFLGNLTGELAQHIAGLLVIVIQALGNVLFGAVTGFLELSMQLNSYIQDSPIVHDGFWVSLTVANLGLVVGILVIALATMVRADWLVDPKTSIPKFIAAALLINFGLFIGTNLVIKPVDVITRTIYEATNVSANNFAGIFKPNLGIDLQLKAQLNIADLGEEDIDLAEGIINYLLLREDQLAPKIEEELRSRENENYFNNSYVPIGVTPSNETIYVSEDARRAVKEEILRITDKILTSLGGGTVIAPENNDNTLFAPATEGWYTDHIRAALSKGNAPYDFYAEDSKANDLVISIHNVVKNELAKGKYLPDPQSTTGNSTLSDDTLNQEIGFECTLWTNNDSQNCKYLFDVAKAATKEVEGLKLAALVLSEVLFYALFLFLGVFTLLTVATLMFMRYIALSILLILFPFTWLGWIFPKISGLGNIWKSWWKEFIRWLLFGPISLFFVYLAIQAASSREKLIPVGVDRMGQGSLATISASIGDMAVVIGLMIGGVIVANKMGVKGAGLFYDGLNKMRKKVGAKAKRGALMPFSPLAKRYKWGKEHVKSATQAGWAGWRTKGDRTKEGRDLLNAMASSSNPMVAALGRRRQGQAARAEAILRKHDARKFMYRDEKGELKHTAGGQRRTQMLEGLLKRADEEEARYGHASDGTMRDISTLSQSLHKDGYQWEAPFKAAMARMEKEDYFQKGGYQDMENDLIGMGLAPKVLQAVNDGVRGDDLVKIMDEEYTKIPSNKFNPDYHMFGPAPAQGKKMLGFDTEEFVAHRDAMAQYMAQYRSSDMHKNYPRSHNETKAALGQSATREKERYARELFDGAEVPQTFLKNFLAASSTGGLGAGGKARMIADYAEQLNARIAAVPQGTQERVRLDALADRLSHLPTIMAKFKDLDTVEGGGITGWLGYDPTSPPPTA